MTMIILMLMMHGVMMVAMKMTTEVTSIMQWNIRLGRQQISEEVINSLC